MTVDPVHSSTTAIERPTPEKKQHAVPTPRSVDSGNQSSGSNSKAEIVRPRNIPAPLAIPEHEVKVILDTPENNTLVYQVLDKQSGDVVLQVPSAEQLRGVHETQELLQRISARGNTATSEGPASPVARREGTNDGSKL
jgi:uncharacterized FlaG/YvyC family protein